MNTENQPVQLAALANMKFIAADGIKGPFAAQIVRTPEQKYYTLAAKAAQEPHENEFVTMLYKERRKNQGKVLHMVQPGNVLHWVLWVPPDARQEVKAMAAMALNPLPVESEGI